MDGKEGLPDEDVGAGEVVEETGWVAVISRSNNDIENATGAVKGFLEGVVACRERVGGWLNERVSLYALER